MVLVVAVFETIFGALAVFVVLGLTFLLGRFTPLAPRLGGGVLLIGAVLTAAHALSFLRDASTADGRVVAQILALGLVAPILLALGTGLWLALNSR